MEFDPIFVSLHFRIRRAEEERNSENQGFFSAFGHELSDWAHI